MSIIGLSAQTLLIPYLLGIIVSMALAVALRVYRPRLAVGPERLKQGDPAWHMLIGLGLGFMTMMAVALLWANHRGLGPPTPGHPQNKPTAADWAFQTTVPPLVFFYMLLQVDWSIGGKELLGRLGILLRRLPAGVVQGLVAALVILPPTYLLTEAAQWFYERLHFSHPSEHELLREMSRPEKPLIHWVLIAAAVVVAPLYEEFLFRGHLQTLIRRMLIAISSPRSRGFLASPLAGAEHPPAPALDVPSKPAVWQTWGALVLTSMLFAAVHPLWTTPPIFFLALGLGYCYERTGNLWTSITVHCLFNSISTCLYLGSHQP